MYLYILYIQYGSYETHKINLKYMLIVLQVRDILTVNDLQYVQSPGGAAREL